MDLIEYIEAISNKEEFCRFLEWLEADCQKNPQEWENKTVNEFIAAMLSWIEDYSSAPCNDIDWERAGYSLFAKVLYMGKLYE